MKYGIPIPVSSVKADEFGDAQLFACGETDQLSFGVLELPAGKTAGYDAGHKNADEIFYVISGEAVLTYPTTEETVRLKTDDFTLVHRDIPHIVSNPGDGALKFLYATCATRD